MWTKFYRRFPVERSDHRTGHERTVRSGHYPHSVQTLVVWRVEGPLFGENRGKMSTLMTLSLFGSFSDTSVCVYVCVVCPFNHLGPT